MGLAQRVMTEDAGQVHVALLGARMHYAVPTLFHERKMLGRFYTDNYIGNRWWLEGLLEGVGRVTEMPSLLGWLGRRAAIAPEKVTSYELMGILSWLRRRRAVTIRDTRRIFAEGNRAFNKRVIASGLQGATVVYACNSAALEIFQYARARGIRCVLEQALAPMAACRALLAEEARRWPGWQDGVKDLCDASNPLMEREQREWPLADLIVCGSDYVRAELIRVGVPQQRCRVVPYGVDVSGAPPVREERDDGKLRVLFAGEVGLRKGAPYLLEALSQLGPGRIEARLAGKIAINREKLKSYASVAHFLGPVPRVRMQELYSWADVLVLPSICEGSATVTYEALAGGVPVVATPNTGSRVRDGIDGHLVPIRDSRAVMDVLNRYLSDPGHLQAQRVAALAARGDLGLEAYGERLVRVVNELVGDAPAP